MENNPNLDPATPAGKPAASPAPELSLADQILAMKAERDARNQQARHQPTAAASEPAKTAAPEPVAEAKENVGAQTSQETTLPIVPEPGAPEAGGPAQAEPDAQIAEPVAATPTAETEIGLMAETTDTKEEHFTPANPSGTSISPAPAQKPVNGKPADEKPAADEALVEAEMGNAEATPPQNLSQAEQEVSLAHTDDDQTDEHDEEQHEEEQEETDYTQFEKHQLAAEIKKFASDETGRNGKKITELYRLYQHRVKDERTEALGRFIETGGEEADFTYHQTEEDAAVEKLVVQFREQKSRQARLQEEVKAKNLQTKKGLIEELRQLAESAEESSSSLDEMKRIQAAWKAVGAVPQGESQELWNVYHALMDMFYNNRSIFNELKDLDRKKNLEAKEALCERAEALPAEESVNKALMELRHLHEEWKNIGPVPAENREPVWERFLKASEAVHQRRKEYLSQRKAQEESNLLTKQNLLSMVDDFQGFVTDRINEWRSKTDELQKLKEVWEKAGLVPKEKAEEINKRFWGAYKAFFNNKNAFFKALDEQKMENLRLKTEMCEYAESLSDSDDFAGTKEKLIQLQKKWKTIGRVPDKHSDQIWNRFRSACNSFFDRKNAEVAAKEAALEEQANRKRAFVQELEERVAKEENATEQGLEEMLAQWRELGTDEARPNKQTESKFYLLAEQYIAKMPGLSEEEKKDKLFQMEVASLKAHPDNSQQLYQKEQTLRKEIQTLENGISTLKTNMEFFARSKNADQIRKDYSSKIDESERKISELKRRLKLFSRK